MQSPPPPAPTTPDAGPSPDVAPAGARPELARGLRYALAALLTLVTLFTYRESLFAGLVYDDLLLVGRNVQIREIGSVLRALWEPYWAFDDPEPVEVVGFWRPLTLVVLALGNWIGGGDPLVLHLVSIGLHVLASLLAWRLAARLTGRPVLAWLAALAFALHPVHVESVAWISAVNDPLYTVFALLSLNAFVRWRLAGSAGAPIASGLWLLPALLSKEQALAVVPVVLTIDLMLAPRTRAGEWRRAYAPIGAAAFVYLALRVGVFASPTAGFERQAAGFALGLSRTLTYTVELFGGFLTLLAWPADLAVFRQVRPRVPAGDPAFLTAVAASVVWLALVLFTWFRRRPLVLGALLFVPASLAPVLVSFESAGAFPLSDRYLYLAVFAWALLLVECAARWIGPRPTGALVALVLVAYSWRATEQTRIYRDDETFFRAAVAASPRTPYVHWGLGRVLLARYQVELDKPLLDEALLHFLTSLYLGTDYGERGPKLPPDAPLQQRVSELNAIVNDTPADQRKPDPSVMWSVSDREQANIGLGWCYLFLADLPGDGDLGTPLHIFQQTLLLFPKSYRALTGLGAVHIRRGEIDEAIEAFRRALELHPRSAEAWHNLGQAHVARQSWDEARRAFEEALAIRPGHQPDLIGVATTAIEAGRFDIAEETLDELRRAEPDGLEPLFWSGMLAARQREFTRALNWFDAVVARESGHGHAHLERGKLLISMNEPTEAIKALGRACELMPDSFEAHYNLGVLQLERVGPEPAKGYLVRAFELSPRGPLRDALHYNLRELLAGDGNAAYSLARLSQARDEPGMAHDWITDAILAGDPWASSGETHRLRGWALDRMGQDEEAVGAYKRSLELDPERFGTNHDLGMLLGSMGRRAEAMPYLEAARGLADQLANADPAMRRAMLEAIDRALDGTFDFSGPLQIPIPAQDVDERWR